MENALMMLLKAFKTENWANQFLDGLLYCNTLSFHRKKDKQEGAVVIPGSNITQFKVGPHELKSVKSFTFRPGFADYINVFCMYSWAPPFDDRTKTRVILNKQTQLGSLPTLEDTYGSHAIMIRDIPEFFRRITNAVERSDSQVDTVRGSLVKYELMGHIPKQDDLEGMIQLAFRKNPKFADEKEYRFVFILDRDKPGPFRLDIGSIRDIAGLVKTSELYDLITVNGSADF